MRSLVVATLTALTLAACAGGEVADEESSPSTTIAPTTTVPLVETTTTAPLVTTTTTSTTMISAEVADAAVAVVVSAIEAKNNFDLDGWLMALAGGQRGGVPLFAEEILMNAEERWEIIEPCQMARETTSGGAVVECLMQDTTSYWGVGGISDTRLQTFTVNTDGLISFGGHFGSSGKDRFNQAFHQWLSDTYPDVYEEAVPGFISGNAPGFDTQNPDHMLIAVEYVEEFVAQSENYPLDPEDQ